jgi:transposase
MAHGVNANLARRWVLEAERRGGVALARAANSALPAAFVAVQLPPAETVPADIRIELSRGTTTINVSWPCSAASQCAAWMRELLR